MSKEDIRYYLALAVILLLGILTSCSRSTTITASENDASKKNYILILKSARVPVLYAQRDPIQAIADASH